MTSEFSHSAYLILERLLSEMKCPMTLERQNEIFILFKQSYFRLSVAIGSSHDFAQSPFLKNIN